MTLDYNQFGNRRTLNRLSRKLPSLRISEIMYQNLEQASQKTGISQPEILRLMLLHLPSFIIDIHFLEKPAK